MSVSSLTPEVAGGEMLGRNTHNRHLSGNVRRIGATSTSPWRTTEWRLNGESIKFGRDGTPRGVQARRCVESRHASDSHPRRTRGLDPRVPEMADSGRKRTVSDVVTMGGTKRAQIVSAAAFLVINHANARDVPKRAASPRAPEGQIIHAPKTRRAPAL